MGLVLLSTSREMKSMTEVPSPCHNRSWFLFLAFFPYTLACHSPVPFCHHLGLLGVTRQPVLIQRAETWHCQTESTMPWSQLICPIWSKEMLQTNILIVNCFLNTIIWQTHGGQAAQCRLLIVSPSHPP